MNENSVTDVLKSLDDHDADVAFDFLLKPFGKTHNDIWMVECQKQCNFKFNGENITTIPDLCIILKDETEIKIEIKTNSNAGLTDSEKIPKSRDLFVIPKNYPQRYEIPKIAKHIVTWEDFFEYCDKHGASISGLNSFKGEF